MNVPFLTQKKSELAVAPRVGSCLGMVTVHPASRALCPCVGVWGTEWIGPSVCEVKKGVWNRGPRSYGSELQRRVSEDVLYLPCIKRSRV